MLGKKRAHLGCFFSPEHGRRHGYRRKQCRRRKNILLHIFPGRPRGSGVSNPIDELGLFCWLNIKKLLSRRQRKLTDIANQPTLKSSAGIKRNFIVQVIVQHNHRRG